MIDHFFTTEDFAVKEFPHRTAREELRMLASAFDCVLPDDSGIYASSESSTGRRFYHELLGRHGVRTEEQLREQLDPVSFARERQALTEYNRQKGLRFAGELRRRGLGNVVAPSAFVAPGFEAEHYQYLWEWVLQRKTREVHFNEGWEYSTGCTLEYAIAARRRLPRFDHTGRVLAPAQAAHDVEHAVQELKAGGFHTSALEYHLALIREFHT